MKRSVVFWILLYSTHCFLTGCSQDKQAGIDAKTDMALVKSALKKAERAHNPRTRIKHLRFAYDVAEQLPRWPNADKVPAFLEKHGAAIKRIPNQVYELSMHTRDMEAFKWAVERSNSADLLQYSELLRVWKMGKQWRDYYLSEYPDKTLSIFMSEAINDNSVRFFNQYIADFNRDNYRLEFPLEKTEFNARFCRFFSDRIKTTMEKGDTERIAFLIDHMPSRHTVSMIDFETEETMRKLGDYVCYELKDEALACRLVELGYDMNRIDIEKVGFSTDFTKVLAAHPVHAIYHVLKLNEWHGPLSEKEILFLLDLTDELLRSIHRLHVDEAIRVTIKKGDTTDAVRLIKIREALAPLTSDDYDRLFSWSLEYRNRAVFDYVKSKREDFNIYQYNLADLANDWQLFRLYAPKILSNIYVTMNKTPRRDGTTYGRIHDLVTTHHPKAVLYVVKNYDLQDEWVELTGGRTLLMDVCEGGNLEAAQYLVEHKGADVFAQTGYREVAVTLFGRSRAREGRLSAIFFAAKSGNSELIEYLASKWANVNTCSAFGATPLMFAVDSGQVDAVRTLLALGADVNVAMDENLAASPELVEAGAYEDISTAYRRALKSDNKEILAVLKKAGVRP